MTEKRFPTRQYSYAGPQGLVAAQNVAWPSGRIFKFRMGREVTPVEMEAIELEKLKDPFAELILKRNFFPTTLKQVLEVVDRDTDSTNGLPEQLSFVIADGGQIAWTPETQNVDRQFRFAVVRRGSSKNADLMVSTSFEIESEETFLQVIAWDESAGAYQFYDRRGGSWIWAGSSWDALSQDTRGKGPFDSHVNGSLNMKELKDPWINWHSMAASIDASLAPDDPIRNEALWTGKSRGDIFETEIVRPGVRRWTKSRFDRSIVDGKLRNAREFFRQIFETTTVNLVSSREPYGSIDDDTTIRLPLEFFFNSDAFLNTLELTISAPQPKVKGLTYLNAVDHFEVELTDGISKFKGDTHFVFLVPEVAFEDLVVLTELIERELLSPKLAASILMVDFSNPVFSERRASLLKYVPETIGVGNTEELSAIFVNGVRSQTSSIPGNSPEQEFLFNWETENWQSEFALRIDDFLTRVQQNLDGKEEFLSVFALAESRRREFRKRPLAEFRLTTPKTNIPEDARLLRLTPQGRVEEK